MAGESSNFMNKLPTIQELREQGWKVRVTHFRLCQTNLPNNSKTVAKNLNNYLSLQRDIPGFLRYNRGGKTIIEVLSPEKQTARAETVCSFSDDFNHKTGNAIALERCLKKVADCLQRIQRFL